MNVVIVLGNLTRDPELKYTSSGMANVNFSIAVNEKWKDKSGELKEEVSFFPVVAWGKLAENIAQYIKKGRQVIVKGKLKQDRWEDKETQEKRNMVKIIADDVKFLGAKSDTAEDAPADDSSDAKKDVKEPF